MPTFYRIVKTDPPTEADFVSDRERGRPRPKNPAHLNQWEGISVFDTEDGARETAIKYPAIGDYIAVLDVPAREGIRAERTLRTSGHYTLWADAAVLLRRVIAVAAVKLA